MRLKAKRLAPYRGKVHDLTVTNAYSYNIEGVPVHNSVGGSLVAYLMGITDIDPIRFGLIFERFINPDRIDLPDADLDFMSTRRGEIITEIKRKYGDQYVAGVSNYTTMGAAGTLNDICRTLQIETDIVFSKYVPKEHGNAMSLEESIAKVPELERFAREQPDIIRLARPIEDRMRSYGTHAAGIVVGGVPLSERAVVERRKGEAVVNWDKQLVEDFGLVKIDILGLSTLDMIDVTLEQVFKNHSIKIDPKTIALDDTSVLEAFGRGETTGVFQFESHGMRRLLRDMASITPLTFDDIAAATALYRPGPMDSGLMAQFVKIKQGTVAPSYPHPSMTDALAETQGVMIYQEQVMRVCRDFAGFSAIDADHLRKIMGKKLPEKMKEWRGKFVEGAVATSGVTEGFAEEIFEQIAKFAGYGFNKSHASAYTLISYQCMWLKVHYPAEFFCGLLTFVKPERREQALRDMQRLKIKLMPPDINESSKNFEAVHGLAVLAPFSCLKGISDNTADAILLARQTGRFTDKKDFEKRIEARKCNVRHREILDKVGAFSRIDPTAMPADHPDRRRDQVELMQDLMADHVVIEREITLDKFKVTDLEELIEGYRKCDLCELAGLCHPKPLAKGPPKMMVIVDGPNYKEEAADELGVGSHMNAIYHAMNEAGLTEEDIYLTALIKSPKPEATKAWSNKTLSECPVWLSKEIDLLRPPLIIVLGSQAARYFTSDLRGGLGEHVGRVIYDKTRDCNILLGINPGMIYFDPSKQALLDDVFTKAITLLGL